MRVTAIHRYPVKSMRGEALPAAVVEPWGLAGDRRWMLIDSAGECVTAREHPQLLLLEPSLVEGGVRISSPGRGDLDVAAPTEPGAMVTVHGREPFAAALAGAHADDWLSDHLGVAVRLAYGDDPTRRRLHPSFSTPQDSASFADSFPLLVTTEASLAQLNQWIAAGRFPEQGPLPMNRFRPNLVVDGDVPFGEDTWRRLRVGTAEFRVPRGCARCVMTTTDAATAARGKEPIASLAVHRRFESETWFGMNLIPDTPGATIAVGDEVEVLEAEASDGPPR